MNEVHLYLITRICDCLNSYPDFKSINHCQIFGLLLAIISDSKAYARLASGFLEVEKGYGPFHTCAGPVTSLLLGGEV